MLCFSLTYLDLSPPQLSNLNRAALLTQNRSELGEKGSNFGFALKYINLVTNVDFYRVLGESLKIYQSHYKCMQ